VLPGCAAVVCCCGVAALSGTLCRRPSCEGTKAFRRCKSGWAPLQAVWCAALWCAACDISLVVVRGMAALTGEMPKTAPRWMKPPEVSIDAGYHRGGRCGVLPREQAW
jgi:hypothetical protein